MARRKMILLGLLGLLAAFVLSVFVFGKQPSHKLPPSQFASLYQTKPYQRLLNTINKQQYVIIEGLPEDGVDIFAAYVLNATFPQQHIVNQRVFSPDFNIQDHTHPLFSSIHDFFSGLVGGKGENIIWVIDSNGPLTEEHLKVVYQMITASPSDKIVLIASSAPKCKHFKKVVYPRPSEFSIQSLLKSKGLSDFQVETVLEKHNNNLESLYTAIQQNTLLDFEKAFESQKGTLESELKEANPKVVTHLKKLCKDGSIKAKKEIPQLQSLKSVGYDNGLYLWASNNYRLAYESISSTNCKETEQFATQSSTQPEEIQPEVQVVEQTTSTEEPKDQKKKKQKPKKGK